MQDLQTMKKQDFSDALHYALPVFDDLGNKLADLVPIGEWATQDSELVECFAKWRKTFMRCFLTMLKLLPNSLALR